MSILCVRPLILDDTSVVGCAYDGQVMPGYYASALWGRMGMTYVWTACRIAVGISDIGDPYGNLYCRGNEAVVMSWYRIEAERSSINM